MKRLMTRKKPIVCLDEKPKQLIRDKRMTISMKPGKPEKYDYEYVKNETANRFMAVESKAGKKMIKVPKEKNHGRFCTIREIGRVHELLIYFKKASISPVFK